MMRLYRAQVSLEYLLVIIISVVIITGLVIFLKPIEQTARNEFSDLPRPDPARGSIIVNPPIVKINKEFTVTVRIDKVSDLFSYQMNLNYDEDKLEYVKQEKGTFLGGFYIPGRDRTGYLDQIAETLTPPTTGKSGSGTLFIVTFKAKKKGTVTFRLSDISLYHTNGEPITDYEFPPASVEITPGS